MSLSRPAHCVPRQQECVDALVSAGWSRQATQIAVSQSQTQLTYAELEQHVARLCGRLRALGAGRGRRVGICLERTPHLPVAVLATLRAGAAYVPLDPNYPSDRLAYMAEQSDLCVLLTESALVTVLPAHDGCTRLVLDDPAEQPALAAVTPVPADAGLAQADDAAYLIFTSGSTGRPKGVSVPHRAVANFLRSMAQEPGMAASDTLVAVTTLSFDIAVLELLLPLYSGARLEIAPTRVAADGTALRSLLESTRATVMQATPTTWRLLLEAGWRGSPQFRVLVGGEPLPADLATALALRSEGVWNLYGPTETTVWSTLWKVQRDSTTIRIGRPIRNTQVHVLDAQGLPCPFGVPGEICIGGDGLSDGYPFDAAQTAERFIADPFATEPGSRLYRTGDLGRWMSDGQLEHLGRRDHQVKLRGYRIEPGEIEHCLRDLPDVADALVTVQTVSSGEPALVAYIVARGADTPSPTALRAALRQKLPAYLIPQHIVPLTALPRLPNGKVDRGSLPVPEHAAMRVCTPSFTDPREQRLVALCRELIGQDTITGEDNFFDAGGHSLLALRLLTRLEAETGVRLNLLRLANSSLRAIAEELPDGITPDTPETPARSGFRQKLGRWLGLPGGAP
ncbi:non-ribosomal peptide synthetase [Tahibacter amnicola]|uniref:Amino acid adenylation domain-containing protein n=1 Tax=Tahibacter amnicola TaxID=2976241 RepID=A0ABY6BKZ3_9GAMM|nr:amino acid adenylation domain-containing protein [Tahibacter amnicola]UXI70698.1 amino acid adenylation domain-containing protein [Tahibacter amnicola]